jgi:hypothetical protein
MLLAEGHRVGVTLVKESVAEWKRQRQEVFVPLVYCRFAEGRDPRRVSFAEGFPPQC